MAAASPGGHSRWVDTHLKWIIGHRGACGYWPENTLVSMAGAHAQGADLIEVDVVLSRDGELVLSHDLYLNQVTDVGLRFPERARSDGRCYALDFDWVELQQLRVGARLDEATGAEAYPGRVLSGAGEVGLCRLSEVLAEITNLNRRTGRQVGLVIEIKAPAWHRQNGREIGEVVRAALAGVVLPLVVETFDPVDLRRWSMEWVEFPQILWWQLLAENAWAEAECDFDLLRAQAGLREIAAYADGVAVNVERATTDFLQSARMAGLPVCVYTVRLERGGDGLRRWLLAAGLNGVFTDQPDVVAAWRAQG